MGHPLPAKPGSLAPSASSTPGPSHQSTNYFTNLGGYQSAAYTQAYASQYSPYHGFGIPQAAPTGLGYAIQSSLTNPYGQNSAGTSHSNGGANLAHRGRPPPGLNGAGTQGPISCGQPGCLFRGSHQDVKVHKMDRHLIFPPGWKKRKRKEEEDVDEEAAARLAGISTIQGTTVVLDSPDAIANWIAERKKRYPTAQRIEGKAKAKEEAIERGQILLPEGPKRNLSFSEPANGRGRAGRGGRGGRGHDRGWGRGRGRGRGRGGSSNPNSQPAPGVSAAAHVEAVPPKPSASSHSDAMLLAYGDSDSESSGSDLDPIRDAVSSKPPPGATQDVDEADEAGDATMHDGTAQTLESVQGSQEVLPSGPSNFQVLQPPKRKPVPKPKASRKAPFSERPSLLRNLLLSDIRTTVSNLSQAIRFLVANDFLEGVELEPGEAANPKIAVIGEGSTGTPRLQSDKTPSVPNETEV